MTMERTRNLAAFAAVLVAASCGGSQSGADETTPPPEVVADSTETAPPAAEPAGDPDPEGPEAEAVRQAVRDYVAAHPGAEEGSFDIPGEARGDAAFEDFHTVHRADDGYLVCVDFRDAEHLYDVDFTLSREDPPAVVGATLHKVDGEVVGD